MTANTRDDAEPGATDEPSTSEIDWRYDSGSKTLTKSFSTMIGPATVRVQTAITNRGTKQANVYVYAPQQPLNLGTIAPGETLSVNSSIGYRNGSSVGMTFAVESIGDKLRQEFSFTRPAIQIA